MTNIVTPDEDPHGHNNSVVETTGAVLLQHIDVVMVENPSDGRLLFGLQLEGRINQSTDRATTLYLSDEAGAASIVAEITGLYERLGGVQAAQFALRLRDALEALP